MRFRRTIALASVAALGVLTAPVSARAAADREPTAIGSGGAVATVDPTATARGRAVVPPGRDGGGAGVAAAATLGVTEPFSSGIGGGGFFVYYDAENNTVHTIDGRESGPADMTTDYFINKATGA